MDSTNSIAADQLQAFVSRIERLEEEKAALAGDIGDIYNEAKSSGFDKKIIRAIIKLRKKSRDERETESALLELYMDALGLN